LFLVRVLYKQISLKFRKTKREVKHVFCLVLSFYAFCAKKKKKKKEKKKNLAVAVPVHRWLHSVCPSVRRARPSGCVAKVTSIKDAAAVVRHRACVRVRAAGAKWKHFL
jgi:hypothetical protein